MRAHNFIAEVTNQVVLSSHVVYSDNKNYISLRPLQTVASGN